MEVAFTDRHGADGAGLDLALDAGPAGIEQVRAALDADRVLGMRQVHGAEVATVDAGTDPSEPPVADGLVTVGPGAALLVRVADCVPVVLADLDAEVVAVAHAGRAGVVAGVVPATVARMREAGAQVIRAWIGPHVCGRCYEVPEAMREEVAAVEPTTWSETSWGTAALDLGAGVGAQLEELGVVATYVARCTREDEDLWSFRRQGAAAGRLGGLVRVMP